MKKYLGLVIIALTFLKAQAQIDHTLYNMSHLPQIQLVNPSFQPTTKWYLAFSGYGKVANTGFVANDLLGNRVGDTVVINATDFLNKLNRKNHVQAVAMADIDFGLRIMKKTYLQFGVSQRVSTRLSVPKDLFEFAILGNAHPDLIDKELNIGGFDMDATHYREVAFGVSHQLNCNLGFGARVKRLTGFENMSTKNTALTLKTDPNTYDLTAKANLDFRTSGLDSLDSRYNSPSNFINGPNNKGWGIDLGATYKYKKFTFSASLLDLGYIRWNENTLNIKSRNPNSEFTFRGVDLNSVADSGSIDQYFQKILDSLEGQFALDSVRGQKYSTSLNTRLYIGGQFKWQSFTVGGTFFSEFYDGGLRPGIAAMIRKDFGRWAQLQVNYSAMNRNWLNIGLGGSVNIGPVQLFFVSDNIIGSLLQPLKTKNVQFRLGANFGWWYGKDCKNPCTPWKEKCEKCAEEKRVKYLQKNDADNDGIKDFWDSCRYTPGVLSLNGCPDADGDMLTDSLDMCPQERGYIYLNGCPDNDQDSIRNSEDDCPNDFGPRELNGCPDTDGDGLLDKNDDCPKIVGPKENNGCPWGDTDEDGLTDNIDNCPEEAGPRENKGCPWGDADGDGLTDNIDKCINQAGPKENDCCPYTDTDNDGVLDKDDECPLTFGVAENKGCPIIEKEEQEVLNTAFDNLEFETGKAIIRSSSFESLDQLAALLIKKPNYKLSIEGHTDNVGNENSNLLLSKSRANAVKIYLESHGVTGAQMTTNWYGAGKPIADNATAEGRQKNRRVEMKVVFD